MMFYDFAALVPGKGKKKSHFDCGQTNCHYCRRRNKRPLKKFNGEEE